MNIPTRRQCLKIWNQAEKKFNFKAVSVSSIFHRGKVCLVRKILKEAGLNYLEERLNEQFMTCRISGKDYILVPDGQWPRVMTPNARLYRLATLAHELTHVFQYRKRGAFDFETDYFNPVYDKERAEIELFANLAGSDVANGLGREYLFDADRIFTKHWRAFYHISAGTTDRIVKEYNKRIKDHEEGFAVTPEGGEILRLIREVTDAK